MKTLPISLFLFFLFNLLFSLSANAQSGKDSFEKDAIYWHLFSYYKNGEYQRNGFMWKNLKKEMEVSPNAVIEFKKAEKNRNLLFASGLVTSGLAIWFLNIDRKDKKKSNAVVYPLLGAEIFTVYFGIKTIKKTKKAVRIRNRDIKK